MSLFPPVNGIQDGEAVDPDVVNRPLGELTERTDFLKEQLDAVLGADTFTSVRIPGVSLATEDTPVLYDFVALDPVSKTYIKAISSAALIADDPFTHAAFSSFAVGILVSVSGSTGTVALYGKLPEITAITLTNLLEPGEIFRDGPYFLSSVQAGKMTAAPKGPAIFLGFFTESGITPGLGDQAVINPQLKDIFQSHLHFNFALSSQPAGDREDTGTNPTSDIHRVRGIKPDDYQPGGGSSGEPPIRMFVLNTYTGNNAPTYTFRVEASDDTLATARVFWSTDDESDDSFPGFDDPAVFGFDPDYGDTIGVRIVSYERPIPIGSKGLSVVFERGYDSTATTPDWDTQDFDALIETAVPVVERTWTILVPDRIQGWLPKWAREISTYTGGGTDPGYRLQLFGRYRNPDARTTETFTVEVTTAGDFATSTVNLQVKDRDGVVVDSFLSVGFSGPALNVLSGSDYDMWLVVSRYTPGGSPAGTTTAALTDSWEFNFEDEAPGSAFEYNIDVDPAMAANYPPSPLGSIVFEANGITLDQRDFFRADDGTYAPKLRTVFWFDERYGRAPFPQDWETLIDPGSDEFAVNAQLFFTKLAIGGTGTVTSLTAAPGSAITIINPATGLPASTGDLQLNASLGLSIEDVNLAGPNAVKGIGPEGQLRTGKVVEKILSGAGVNITESDPNFPGQGTVTISFAAEGVTRGDFQDIVFLNAKQELVPGRLFSFIKLLGFDATVATNVPSGFLARFRVPLYLTGKYRVIINATVFGLVDVPTGLTTADTQFAGITVTYSVLQDLTTESSPATFVYVPRSLLTTGPSGVLEHTFAIADDVPFGKLGVGYDAFDPILLHNDPSITSVEGQVTSPFFTPFPIVSEDPASVTAGDLVAVRFSRSAPAGSGHTGNAAYTSPVGFINLTWRLVEV